jgi:predicted HTH transcriptional regulator
LVRLKFSSLDTREGHFKNGEESKFLRGENGARGSKLDEPLVFQRNYQVEWVAPRVNLRELALLRFIQGKTERELAQYFGRSKTAIHELLARMVKNDFRHANLTKQEKERITWQN